MRYFSFVYLERDYDLDGRHLNTYFLKTLDLPQPQRHVPYYMSAAKDEVSPEQLYSEAHDELKKFLALRK